MRVVFNYSREKDVWCLLNTGKSSNNNPHPTEVYTQLVAQYGENPDEQNASKFIAAFFAQGDISVRAYAEKYAAEWSSIADEYYKRAEAVFNITLPHDITAYLTVNIRNPYSISENLFYVTVPRDSVQKTVMHELWHFYTWYGLGTEQESIVGKQKYNELKEALTVLLNIECVDLLPKGVIDIGYPQHQEVREKILTMWRRHKDIKVLWKELTQ